MGFRINTNIAALNAHNNATMNNRSIDNSLSRLSSGLRINTAADDASGMAIADSLRSQANSLGQAVRNANDAIGIIQTADKAMDEQLKILDTIKTKAIQAASDTQTGASRQAIQSDVNRLIEQLDNIAKTTTFNGSILLGGGYANKEFQIGAYSNQTVNASINNTESIAIGGVSTKTDVVQVGNVAVSTLTVPLNKGSDTITFSAGGIAPQGLAQGDTIRIDGIGDFKVENILGAISAGGAMSAATITLDRELPKGLSIGSTLNISLISTTSETLSALSAGVITAAAGTVTVNSGDISGFAVGDTFQYTNSVGEAKTFTITTITGSSAGALSGSIVFSSTDVTAAAGTLSLGSLQVSDRASLGTDFATSDYVQYTIEGVKLDAIQLTDENGDGVAQSGLGRVADLINASTNETDIKAVATVEQNSNIRVAPMTIATDVEINGIVVLEAGAIIKSSDSDNTLLNAINAKTAETGVRASIETDGSMTLTSDGRAMNTSGLSAVAGINDGVHAGTLEFIKIGGGDIAISSEHFSDADLMDAAAADVKGLEAIVNTNVLSDLVFGRVDDTGDGIVDTDDKVGLLRTAEGSMLAMDIVESATTALDSARADLGSVQNQLIVTVNNISVTAVNVKAAESQIRDVDFAAESATFSKHNILAQSGSYAMSQANAIQQNVLKLLQ